jgi:hypothetical protein
MAVAGGDRDIDLYHWSVYLQVLLVVARHTLCAGS